jgi:hypothetical protein
MTNVVYINKNANKFFLNAIHNHRTFCTQLLIITKCTRLVDCNWNYLSSWQPNFRTKILIFIWIFYNDIFCGIFNILKRWECTLNNIQEFCRSKEISTGIPMLRWRLLCISVNVYTFNFYYYSLANNSITNLYFN